VGLEPVEITKDNIKTIIGYLNDIGVNLLSEREIPLAFNYKCSG